MRRNLTNGTIEIVSKSMKRNSANGTIENISKNMKRNSANGTIENISSSGNSISGMLTGLPHLKLKMNVCVSCLLSRAVKDR